MRIVCLLALVLGCGGPPRPTETAGRMKIQLLDFCDQLAKGLRDVDGAHRNSRVAVLYFRPEGERVIENRLHIVFSDFTMHCLRENHRFNLAERERLSDLMDQAADLERVTDPRLTQEKAQRLAATLAVDSLVVGHVVEVGREIAVSARVIDLAANVKAVALVRLDEADLPNLPPVAARRWEALFRSALVPGWGQLYNGEPVKGGIVLATELGLLGTALGFHLAGNHALESYEQDLRVTVSERELAESRYTTRNALLWTAGGVWVANLVDAWLAGYVYDPETAFDDGRIGMSPMLFDTTVGLQLTLPLPGD